MKVKLLSARVGTKDGRDYSHSPGDVIDLQEDEVVRIVAGQNGEPVGDAKKCAEINKKATAMITANAKAAREARPGFAVAKPAENAQSKRGSGKNKRKTGKK